MHAGHARTREREEAPGVGGKDEWPSRRPVATQLVRRASSGATGQRRGSPQAQEAAPGHHQLCEPREHDGVRKHRGDD